MLSYTDIQTENLLSATGCEAHARVIEYSPALPLRLKICFRKFPRSQDCGSGEELIVANNGCAMIAIYQHMDAKKQYIVPPDPDSGLNMEVFREKHWFR